MSIRVARLLAGVVLSAASSAFAAHAPAEMILDKTAVAPGGTATLAIVFKIDPDWHLYWLNPGAAGAPPKVKWTLPAGVTVGEIQFPVPKFKLLSDLPSFVYENEVALLADVTVPANASGTVELKAHLKVVVCEEACVLEDQEVSLQIPIGPGEANAAGRFAAWRAAQPARHMPLRQLAAAASPGDASAGRITVTAPKGAVVREFFPPRSRFLKFDPPKPQPSLNTDQLDAYTIDFRVLPDPPAEFSGPGLVVQQDAAGKTSAEEMLFTFKFAKP